MRIAFAITGHRVAADKNKLPLTETDRLAHPRERAPARGPARAKASTLSLLSPLPLYLPPPSPPRALHEGSIDPSGGVRRTAGNGGRGGGRGAAQVHRR